MTSSEKNNPFVTVTINCPICTRDSEQRYVKNRLYTPLDVEADQHVLTYKWESPQFEGIRPNFYHLWHCPHCQFTDEREVMRGEDDSGGKLELIREKVLIQARAPKGILVRLGAVTRLEQEYVTLESALCAHLLAIHVQEMLSPNMRQYAKLGRLYLRTAWLFREKATFNQPEQDVPAGYRSYQDFFLSLRDEWPDLPLNEDAAIERAIFYYQSDLDRTRRVDDVRYEVTLLFLIADLHRRLNRLDDSLQIIRQIFQMATQKRQSTRQVLDAAVSKGKGTAKQIDSLRSLVTWLNNTIDRATSLAEEINDLIFTNEYPDARENVLKMPEGATPQQVLEHLREAKFHEITCRRVAAIYAKRRLAQQTDATTEPPAEAAPPEPEKPKGFWDSLKDRLST